METSEKAGDLLDMGLSHFISRKELGHYGIRGHPLHLHSVLHSLSRSLNFYVPFFIPFNGHNTDVHVAAEGPVPPDLLLAIEPALLKGGEVQETKVNGFFHFIDKVVCEEDKG